MRMCGSLRERPRPAYPPARPRAVVRFVVAWRHELRRSALVACVLIAGAAANCGVAWLCAVRSDPTTAERESARKSDETSGSSE